MNCRVIPFSTVHSLRQDGYKRSCSVIYRFNLLNRCFIMWHQNCCCPTLTSATSAAGPSFPPNSCGSTEESISLWRLFKSEPWTCICIETWYIFRRMLWTIDFVMKIIQHVLHWNWFIRWQTCLMEPAKQQYLHELQNDCFCRSWSICLDIKFSGIGNDLHLTRYERLSQTILQILNTR